MSSDNPWSTPRMSAAPIFSVLHVVLKLGLSSQSPRSLTRRGNLLMMTWSLQQATWRQQRQRAINRFLSVAYRLFMAR